MDIIKEPLAKTCQVLIRNLKDLYAKIPLDCREIQAKAAISLPTPDSR
jgi:hypothetical protein